MPSDRDRISAKVSGSVQGPVAIGKDIIQTQTARDMTVTVSEAERAQVREAFAALRVQVAEQAPEERRSAALSRVEELEEAVVGAEPDPTTVQLVARWFARQLPTLATAVGTVLVHPIVGRIMGAVGDAAVRELGLSGPSEGP